MLFLEIRVLFYVYGSVHRLWVNYISILPREQKLTILLNLHAISMARKYATRIIRLAYGKIVFDGLPSPLNDEAIQLIYPPEKDELCFQT